MVLSGIAAHGQDDIRILDVDPPIGHRPTTECGGQTGHRWTVSYSSLTVAIDDAQPFDEFVLQPIELVGVGAAANHGNAGRAVDDLTSSVLGDEGAVACVLDVPSNLGDGL